MSNPADTSVNAQSCNFTQPSHSLLRIAVTEATCKLLIQMLYVVWSVCQSMYVLIYHTELIEMPVCDVDLQGPN